MACRYGRPAWSEGRRTAPSPAWGLTGPGPWPPRCWAGLTTAANASRRRAATPRGSRLRALGCRVDSGQGPAVPDAEERLRSGWGHVCVFLFKAGVLKEKAAGLRALSGLARPGDSRSRGYGRGRPASRRPGLAAVPQGQLLGYPLFRRLLSRQPGCRAGPTQSLFQQLGSPSVHCSENCWGVCVCVFNVCDSFFPVCKLLNRFYLFYTFLLHYYPLPCQLCFRHYLSNTYTAPYHVAVGSVVWWKDSFWSHDRFAVDFGFHILCVTLDKLF